MLVKSRPDGLAWLHCKFVEVDNISENTLDLRPGFETGLAGLLVLNTKMPATA